MTPIVVAIVNQDPVRVSLVQESNIRVSLGDPDMSNTRVIVKPDNPSLKISVSTDNGVLGSTENGITLVSGASDVVNRLDNLLDVVESDPDDRSTLVYDKATDKYVVKTLNLDGGTF